ncbi:MAG: hypothetical protein ACXWQO_09170 [Bdellovibrionota bacterium]
MRYFRNRTGLVFAGMALVLGLASYYFLFTRGTVEPFTFPLLYSGFGLPFFSSLFFKSLGGCGIKDGGCDIFSFFGFGFGFFLLLAIYYGLGCLVAWVNGRLRKQVR